MLDVPPSIGGPRRRDGCADDGFEMIEIINAVWKGAPATSNDAVRVHVGALRRKLEPDASNPQYVVTEPWIGYRFIAEPLAS